MVEEDRKSIDFVREGYDFLLKLLIVDETCEYFEKSHDFVSEGCDFLSKVWILDGRSEHFEKT